MPQAAPFQGAQGSWGRQPQDHTLFEGTGEEQNVADPSFSQQDPSGAQGVRGSWKDDQKETGKGSHCRPFR